MEEAALERRGTAFLLKVGAVEEAALERRRGTAFLLKVVALMMAMASGEVSLTDH